MNYWPGLALNHNPPDLSLPSSCDYRCEPPVSSTTSLYTQEGLPLCVMGLINSSIYFKLTTPWDTYSQYP
jgi:hypothetical protein